MASGPVAVSVSGNITGQREPLPRVAGVSGGLQTSLPPTEQPRATTRLTVYYAPRGRTGRHQTSPERLSRDSVQAGGPAPPPSSANILNTPASTVSLTSWARPLAQQGKNISGEGVEEDSHPHPRKSSRADSTACGVRGCSQANTHLGAPSRDSPSPAHIPGAPVHIPGAPLSYCNARVTHTHTQARTHLPVRPLTHKAPDTLRRCARGTTPGACLERRRAALRTACKPPLPPAAQAETLAKNSHLVTNPPWGEEVTVTQPTSATPRVTQTQTRGQAGGRTDRHT